MKLLDKFKGNELVKGSITLFFLINLFNFLNYLFQFAMARMLGPAEFSVFSVLMAMVYVLNIPIESIQLIASKYTSNLYNTSLGQVKGLLFTLFYKGQKVAFFLYLIFIPLSFLLSFLLSISPILLLFAGSLIFLSFIIPINRGILQGRKQFSALGWSMVVEALFKIFLGVLFVFIGWKVYGAFAAIFIGVIISLFLSFFFVRDIIRTKKEDTNIKGIFDYSFSVFLSMIIINVMLAIDVIFAKMFFTDEVAGSYAIASLFGKMIFLGAFPISKAMFPLTSNNTDVNNSRRNLKNAINILSLLTLVPVLLLALFPKIMILVLFGEQYVGVSNLLWIVGLSSVFLSFANLFLFYLLSLKEFKHPYILTIFPVIQILLFIFLHQSLFVFSIALLTANSLLFLFSLFEMEKNTKLNKF